MDQLDIQDESRSAELLLDLFDTAEDLMRSNLKRAHPEASRAEIERRLRDWYLRGEPVPPGMRLVRRLAA